MAEVALVDRSGGEADLGVPFFPLVALNFPTYAEDELPEDLAAIPDTKAGEPRLIMAESNVLNPGKLRLGVNIDHVATIRNARGGDHPDPVRAAEIVARVGR